MSTSLCSARTSSGSISPTVMVLSANTSCVPLRLQVRTTPYAPLPSSFEPDRSYLLSTVTPSSMCCFTRPAVTAEPLSSTEEL